MGPSRFQRQIHPRLRYCLQPKLPLISVDWRVIQSFASQIRRLLLLVTTGQQDSVWEAEQAPYCPSSQPARVYLCLRWPSSPHPAEGQYLSYPSAVSAGVGRDRSNKASRPSSLSQGILRLSVNDEDDDAKTRGMGNETEM